MIPSDEIIILASRLFFGAFAAFGGILLWSRTRNPAWMFIILGALFQYGEIVIMALELSGVAALGGLDLWGISGADLFFKNLPLIFYGIGLIIAFRQTKH